MAKVISSTFTEGAPEIDGRRWVHEEHTCDNGWIIPFEWLGNEDAQRVADARAAELNAQFERQEAAEALVVGTLIPLSSLAFRELFPAAKRQLIDEFHATFETHPQLDSAQKRQVRTGLEDFRYASYVRRPFDSRVLNMIGLYQALGFLTAEEAEEILSHG